ncbi:transcription termination factor Rho [Kribbella albertanoniae]|uniref:Transcription termination factor Rho n=1 Tax=Kribbella albertanoniae TaxID=1266829 RepID=A0A4R4QI37_9ACTN|nr:transcription termination factor Rho [Kribbella albertanoniae]TDC35230.1 transcription termination factor Rho [Kribbella albertanoniae]
MTETVEASSSDAAAGAATRRRKAGGGLEGMLLPELKQLAGTLGIKGTGALRKGQLIEAIKAAQTGGSSRAKATQPTLDEGADAPAKKQAPAKREGGSRRTRAAAAATEAPAAEAPKVAERQQPAPVVERAPVVQSAPTSESAPAVEAPAAQNGTAVEARTEQTADREQSRDRNRESQGRDRDRNRDTQRDTQNRDGNRESQGRDRDRNQGRDGSRDGNREQSRDQNRDQGRDNRQQDRQQDRQQEQGGEEGDSRRRRRRGRDRDRNRDGQPVTSGRESGRDAGRESGRDSGRNRGRGERFDPEPTISEDDVLVPAAGILDVLDNYAFVRTSGYLPGPNDVYVALSMVKRYGLRKGDAITGAVKQPQEGERKEKFNPLVRIDTVNGSDPEIAKQRQDFNKLTPLYATERLRLETEPGILTTRIVDIVSPIGKGQRGLIVSPPKAGKTMVLQALANAITTNNPEVHLMVVLVDERPEEVTDMQRTVKGEVIASTFDRPADDHTTVAELAIERAKRLVELGHDVVVLLDSITRLGRAYNIAAPASGRILSGGVDSSALYPPKRFFGAARNIEDGGSLTILATALIETGSKMDEVIFEEFKGTGNMELRLRREFADRRIFPAIDVVASGTRREELLMSKDETQVVWKLRRVLSALDGQAALELLIGKLKESKSNIEFLLQVNKTTPSAGSTHSTTNGD